MFDNTPMMNDDNIGGPKSDRPVWQYVFGAGVFLIIVIASVAMLNYQKNSNNSESSISTSEKDVEILSESKKTATNEVVKDSDNDGLSDSEERELGTDPYLADSDGDGFNDKSEIDAGYDPLGEGELENTDIEDGGKKEPRSKADCYVEKSRGYDYACISELAKITFNYDLCREFERYTPHSCLQGVAVYNKDFEGCLSITDKNSSSYCLILTAAEAKDDEICEHIVEADRRDICLRGVGEKTENIATCLKIASLDKEGQCIRATAKVHSNANLCAQIKDQTQRNWCYYDIAKNKKDISLCARINEPERKDYCFMAVAVEKTDKEICKSIIDPNRANSCLVKLYSGGDAGQDEKLKIAQEVFEKNIMLVLLYRLVGLIIGVLVLGTIIHWAARKVSMPAGGPEITYQIVAIVGAVSFFSEILSIVIGLYAHVFVVFAQLIRVVSFFLNIFLYFYLFSKWHKTTNIENLKIFGLTLLILIVLSIALTVVIYGVFYVLLLFSFSTGGGFM